MTRAGQPARIVDRARVAALQADAEPEPFQAGAAGDRRLDAPRAVAAIARDAADHQHLRAQADGQRAHVGGAAAAQDVDRLAHLGGVADGVAERLVHVRQQRPHR